MKYALKFDPEDVMLSVGEVARITKKSAPTIYRLMRKDQFPKNINVAGRSLWLRSEVLAYLNDCVEKRNQKLEKNHEIF
jgi:predicted DNA-binding transcriptional regulator AlpA